MTNFKVGAILQNSVGQFTKVISEKNGVYGISGWTTKGNAEKATIAMQFMNGYGLEYAGAKVVKADSASKASAPATTAKAPAKAAAKKATTTKAKAK